MLSSTKRPSGKRFEGGRVRKLLANNSLTRQRAFLRFSSDPCAVNEKVKLCQLVVKGRRHWVRDLEISLRQTSLIGKRGCLRNAVADRVPVFQDLGKGL